MLKQLADILSEAADVLTESVEQGKPEERETYYRRVKEVERKGDMVTHQVLDELETTFITPLDREDINALASGIDDVIDCVNSCAKRINIYNPRVLGDSARELCHFIQQRGSLYLQGGGRIECVPEESGSFAGGFVSNFMIWRIRQTMSMSFLSKAF